MRQIYSFSVIFSTSPLVSCSFLSSQFLETYSEKIPKGNNLYIIYSIVCIIGNQSFGYRRKFINIQYIKSGKLTVFVSWR